MSIDRAVNKFESLLKDVDKIIPALLKDGSIGYQNYIIKRTKSGTYDLIQLGKRFRNNINTYYLKSSALMAAQHHKNNRIMELSRTKDLDNLYWFAHTDSLYFYESLKKTKDEFKRDVFLWRYEQARDRSEHYKQQITQAYNFAFR
ncbi:hypothetical protein EBU71_04470 [bacterium]|nr:hypothetical protein [Candidatus Elulimicrobium humile]